MSPKLSIWLLQIIGALVVYVPLRRFLGWPMLACSAASLIGFFGLPFLVSVAGMKATKALAMRSPEGRTYIEAYDREQKRALARWEEIEQEKRHGKQPDPEEEAALRSFLFGE